MPPASTLRALACAATLCLTLHTQAAFIQIDAAFFGTPAVVGIDPLTPAQSALINFDIDPNGNTIATPTSLLGSFLDFSAPITNTYAAVGVTFGPDDRAVSQPESPEGLGSTTLPNSIAGSFAAQNLGPIDIFFTDPVTAAGIHVADGPTNETFASFFDADNNLITTLGATNNQPALLFLAISTDTPIARIQVFNTNTDDYFADNLLFIVPNVVPEPTALALFTTLSTIATTRRRRSANA